MDKVWIQKLIYKKALEITREFFISSSKIIPTGKSHLCSKVLKTHILTNQGICHMIKIMWHASDKVQLFLTSAIIFKNLECIFVHGINIILPRIVEYASVYEYLLYVNLIINSFLPISFYILILIKFVCDI